MSERRRLQNNRRPSKRRLDRKNIPLDGDTRRRRAEFARQATAEAFTERRAGRLTLSELYFRGRR